MLCHPEVNQASHNPAYVRGLMGPTAALSARREAAWIYSQAGFNVYANDLRFYSEDFDAEQHLEGLDARTFGISLLTGAYDYSASPDDTRRVALIPGRALRDAGAGAFSDARRSEAAAGLPASGAGAHSFCPGVRMSLLPTYEVYALRYATVDRKRRENFIATPDPHEGAMPMDYYVWLIRNGERVVLVDTGFNADAAKARGGRSCAARSTR